MQYRQWQWIGLVLVIAMTLAPAASATGAPVRYFLSGIDHDDPTDGAGAAGVGGVLAMYQGGVPAGGPPLTALGNAATFCEIWLDVVGAELDNAFPSQDVQFNLDFAIFAGVESVAISVGVFELPSGGVGTYTPVGGDSYDAALFIPGVLGNSFLADTFPVPAFTVPDGGWIATEVCVTFNQGSPANTGGEAVMNVQDQSWVQFDSGPDMPPIPELPAIVLAGTGLMAVAGLTRMRKREL